MNMVYSSQNGLIRFQGVGGLYVYVCVMLCGANGAAGGTAGSHIKVIRVTLMQT